MKFVDDIFASRDATGQCEVPLTEYQEYTFRRFKLDRQFNTDIDLDRFKALVWFIEGYSVLRKPLQVPFTGEQISWLLSSSAGYMSDRALPRIVEVFWRRSLAASHNPYINPDCYPAIAYWWSVELAPSIGLHALVPEAFVAALRAPAAGQTHPVPLSFFIKHHMDHRKDAPWSATSEAERLACYIRLLSEPEGLHYSLFFPDSVITQLRTLETPADDWSSLFHIDLRALAPRIRARAEKAAKYRADHKRIRAGAQDISAAKSGRSWETEVATPAPRGKVAPRPKPAFGKSPLPFPVRLIGPINSQSGLGQATRMSIDTLHAAGIEVELLDFYLDNPAPRTAFWQDSQISEAPFAVNLLHLNAESVPLAAAYLDPKLFKNAYNIGYFFWELPQPARCHDLAVRTLDEIWVSSEFNRETYAAVTQKPVVKVGMAVESLPDIGRPERGAVRRSYGLPEDATVFMATFDGFSFIKRKNPAATLRAFLAAFKDVDENVALILKTHNLSQVLGEANVQTQIAEIVSLVESDPRIVLLDETLPFQQLLVLKSSVDCYVTLHRSEGWGFGAVEAMQLGLPVIATDFSGNLEFCTPETAFNVPYKQTFLERDDYIFVQGGDYWAEPDVEAAARFMRQVHENKQAAQAMGARGQALVASRFSVDAVAQRYLDRLKAIAAEQGKL